MTEVYHLFICPVHGILSEREADDSLIEGVDWENPNPDGDIYTGRFFCDLPDRDNPVLHDPGDGLGFHVYAPCKRPVREVDLVERPELPQIPEDAQWR